MAVAMGDEEEAAPGVRPQQALALLPRQGGQRGLDQGVDRCVWGGSCSIPGAAPKGRRIAKHQTVTSHERRGAAQTANPGTGCKSLHLALSQF